MKQTSTKSNLRNNKTLGQHCTVNTKNTNCNYSKSPMINKKRKDFLIHKSINKKRFQRQFNSTNKEQNDSNQKENYQIENIIPEKLLLKPKLLVNRNPLQANNDKSLCQKGCAESSNISSVLYTDESILEEEKLQHIQEENYKNDKPDKEIKHKITRSRATSNRIITSRSLVKKKSSTVLPNLKSDAMSNGNSNLFEYENEKTIELSHTEKEEYGDRQLDNYVKGKLLGKGGCGIVWSCINNSNGKEYALKQISKKPNKIDGVLIQTHNAQMAKKEIEILTYISKQLHSTHDINSKNMITLYEHYEDSNDVWLVFEKGGKSLSALSLKIKGEFCGSERVYTMKQGKFLHKLVSDINQLKLFIKQMLSFIHFLAINNIVHGDIKPDNILINFNNDDYSIKDIKVIDFGSAYFLTNPSNFSSNTPEYMSPEITKLLESNKSLKEIIMFLNTLRECPWCVDIWSLGVSLLETVLACPLWMSYKAKVTIRGKTIIKTGLFGVKGRDGNKIYNKQLEVSRNLSTILKQSLISNSNDKLQFCDLLSKMLEIDHTKRISPIEALSHPFLLNNDDTK